MNLTHLGHAIAIAKLIHRGQKDKGGNAYIDHPLRVMEKMSTTEEKVVAVLHDVIEDGNADAIGDNLISVGFSPVVLVALQAITKRKGEPYENYIQRVIANPLALRVKIADMEDNMDLSRIPHPTEKDEARLQKYTKTLPVLKKALEDINPTTRKKS